MSPAIVCVVGRKKSGKTTTVLKLVLALRARGYRVMTVKHGHDFDLDREGTDSWRHRHEAGAERVVLASPTGMAVVGSWPGDREAGPEELAAQWLADADVVVVEGFKAERLPKIEVFRRAAHEHPIYDGTADSAAEFIAGVTDDPAWARDAPFPAFDADAADLGDRLADVVESRLLGR